MHRDLKNLLWISVVVLILGGIEALIKLWTEAAQVLWAFFPILSKMAVENYISSAYFLTGLVMAIATGFGVWFGVKGGKSLYTIISSIILLISLFSLGCNLL